MIQNVKSSTDLSGMYIHYQGSTINESKGMLGISHLMEHLICKSWEDMEDVFAQKGIDWNAWTSNDSIMFYWLGLDEYLKPFKKDLIKRISKFSITEKQLENEKKIVIEEYNNYFSMPREAHSMNLSRIKFNDFDPIGLREDIENIDLKMCKEYFDFQFKNPHKIINISKNSPLTMNSLVFNDIEYHKSYKLGNYNNKVENMCQSDNNSIIYYSDIVSKDFAYIKFICKMLSDGLNSPLMQEVREKRGLAYGIGAYLTQLSSSEGSIKIFTDVSDTSFATISSVVEEVLDNPDKYITQKRLDIVKEGIEIKLKKDKINQYKSYESFIMKDDAKISLILPDINLEKVLEVYNRYFKFKKFSMSVFNKDGLKA